MRWRPRLPHHRWIASVASNAMEKNSHFLLHFLRRIVDRFATAFDVLARASYRVTTRYGAKRTKHTQDHQYRKDLPCHDLFPCVMFNIGRKRIATFAHRGLRLPWITCVSPFRSKTPLRKSAAPRANRRLGDVAQSSILQASTRG